MPGHEFEKNVQQQMEDLRISPSQAVWNGVEKEMQKHKRRRRILLVLPLLLLIGIGAYLTLYKAEPGTISDNKQKNLSNDTKNSVADPSAVAVSPTNNSKQATGNADPLTKKEVTTTIDDNSTQTSASRDNKSTDNNAPVNNAPVSSNETTHKSRATDVKKEAVSIVDLSTKKRAEKNVRSNNSSQLVNNNPAITSAKEKKRKSTVKNNVAKSEDVLDNKIVSVNEDDKTSVTTIASNDKPSVATIDSSSKELANPPLNTVTDTIKVEQPAATEPVVSLAKKAAIKNPAKDRRWQFGIIAGAGVSKLAQGFSAFDKSVYMDAASGLNSNTPPSTPAINYVPATIEQGFSWNAGVFVQRKINDRFRVSAGLQYMLYGTKSNIGSKVDSLALISNFYSNTLLVSQYYRNTGRVTNYSSRYHLIELPLSIHFQLNKGKVLPFNWSTGLTFGYLTGTNALNFDGSSGYYYKDDELYKRFQYGFNMGLSLTFLNKTKHPLEVGPQFHYKFSNILKSDSDPRHLLGGSLVARWYLRR